MRFYLPSPEAIRQAEQMARNKKKGQLSRPSTATVKRLFAVSGNRCAFPKCTVPLVEDNSGKVTGRTCHIRASNAGGPRFDESQTEVERHAFENLILLCPIHHDVIDADEESYNVERLEQIKEAHEIANAGGEEPDDEVAMGLVLSLDRTTVIDGSIIFSSNQLGGQVAHQITNIGAQPRQISSAARNQIIATLRQLPPESVKITAILGDPESMNLGMVLREILGLAGWTTEPGINQRIFNGLPRGVIIQVSSERDPVRSLGNCLLAAGLQSHGELDEKVKGVVLIIGAKV